MSNELQWIEQEITRIQGEMLKDLTPSERFGVGLGEIDWLAERILVEAGR